jgi:hypothetical protein
MVQKIKNVLIQEKYTPTPADPCLFRCIVAQKIYFLMLYVDVILLFANKEEITRVKAFMMKEFQWTTVVSEMTQSYLGMNVEVQNHAVIMDMRYYIDQLLLQLPLALTKCNTPAIKECFQAKPTDSPLLNADVQKQFHTVVVKLLYLAKRACPDILTVTSFLCTRVKLPTKLDQKNF